MEKMDELTQCQKEKIIRVNSNLAKFENKYVKWLMGSDAYPLCNCGYFSAQILDRELVHTWSEGAEAYHYRPDHVAAVFPLHPELYDGTNFNDFIDRKTFPGGQHHCYSFHELCSHLYGSNYLSWGDISCLSGAYLQVSIEYERRLELFANNDALSRRSEKGFASGNINRILAAEEIRLKQALMALDKAWLVEINDNNSEWIDYEISFCVMLYADEGSPLYTDQNCGELAKIKLFGVERRLSQEPVSVLEKLGDGKIHSPASSWVQLNEPCCFLYKEIYDQILYTYQDLQYVDNIYLFAEVSAKTDFVVRY